MSVDYGERYYRNTKSQVDSNGNKLSVIQAAAAAARFGYKVLRVNRKGLWKPIMNIYFSCFEWGVPHIAQRIISNK